MKAVNAGPTASIVVFLLLVSFSTYSQSVTRNPNSLDDRTIKMSLNNVTASNVFTQALLEAEMPGGIVVSRTCGIPPTHNFPLSQPTVRELLEGIVSVDPEYSWEIRDGVVNLISRADEPQLLETRITRFEIADIETPNEALNALFNLPIVRNQASRELGARLISGFPYAFSANNAVPQKRKFSVKVTDATVRDVLNAIARAYGTAVWTLTRQKCLNNNRKTYSLSFVFN
jgi:hypothetical protein